MPNHDVESVRQLIRTTVANAQAPFLDEPVQCDNEIHLLLDALMSADLSEPKYAQVPIRNLVGLIHRNFYPTHEPMSWRSAIQHLSMEDWGPRVIEFLESENHGAEFPSTKAKEYLTITAYGGSALCTRGVHRLVAACGWLAGTRGEDAVLHKVEVTFRELHPQIRDLITRIPDGIQTFQYSQEQTRDKNLCGLLGWGTPKLLLRVGKRPDYYYWTEQEILVPIQVMRFPRLRRFLFDQKDDMEYSTRSWKSLPEPVRRTLLDDGWCSG